MKINYTMGPCRPEDVSEIWADATKAQNELQSKAQLNLETMLLSAWKWEKSLKETPL